MKRVMVFIDGFNLYHGICALKNHRYKWINLWKLSEMFIMKKNEKIEEVFYYTAYANWDNDKVNRHGIFIKAQKHFNVTPVLGKFKIKPKNIHIGKNNFGSLTLRAHLPEEKKTDVNMALGITKEAFLNNYDKAIIISGDTDIIPAIELVSHKPLEKEIKIVCPPNRRLNIQERFGKPVMIKKNHFEGAIMDDEIEISETKKIHIPEKWTKKWDYKH